MCCASFWWQKFYSEFRLSRFEAFLASADNGVSGILLSLRFEFSTPDIPPEKTLRFWDLASGVQGSRFCGSGFRVQRVQSGATCGLFVPAKEPS